MRLIFWNCNMALHRKFDAVADLKPDIAVISECADPPTLLRRGLDISPDGERFLMIREDGIADTAMDGSRINVVLNWRQELLEKIPVK